MSFSFVVMCLLNHILCINYNIHVLLQRTEHLSSCNFIHLAVNEGKGHAMHINYYVLISSVLKIL